VHRLIVAWHAKVLKNELINKQYNAHTYIKKKKENIQKCFIQLEGLNPMDI
jgi:hypothetical protein